MRWLNIDYTSKINDFSKFTDGNHASFSNSRNRRRKVFI